MYEQIAGIKKSKGLEDVLQRYKPASVEEALEKVLGRTPSHIYPPSGNRIVFVHPDGGEEIVRDFGDE